MNKKKWLKWAVVLIGIAIIGNVILYITGQSPFNLENVDVSESIDANEVRHINIDSRLGSVQVEQIEGSSVEVTMTGKVTKRWKDDYTLDLSQVGGQLQIHVKQQTGFHFFEFYNNLELQVGIPEGTYESIHIVTEDAPIDLQQVKADTYRLQSDTGHIEAAVPSGQVTTVSDTGKVVLQLEEIMAPISIVTDTGDIQVTTTRMPEAIRTNLITDSGSIEVNLPEQVYQSGQGPLVELQSDTGDLTLSSK
ncbi:DUF4097 family beta strand repeat-containing protein [Marinicrinis sediminis]|uniref:DUF4097 family beta strand repeat-containing protein n=1 Tax=Marinicrinis sediminis TaxID=1652465 RepID=A0ABW5RAY7_9BACL